MTYEFMLPWPPSVNAWKTPFRNRMILSAKGREYRKLVAETMDGLRLSGEMVSGRLSASLTLEPPTLRKYDIDNFCKSLFDALTACGFWVDDELVDRLTICKGSKRKGGNVIVKIEVME